MTSTYDVVIVGARCAGAATAMLLARAGARVLVLDRGEPGTDVLSTHALMRGGVLQLARWGLLDRVVASGAPAVQKATFHYGDDATAFPIEARDGVDALLAPRRTVLDPILVEAARDAGAHVRHRTRVLDVVREHRIVRGVVIAGPDGGPALVRASLVIGADGLRSTVARQVGAVYRVVGRHATALLYGYWPGLPADGYHWYWRPGISAGVIPTHDGAACVFVAVPPDRFRRELRDDLSAGYRRLLVESAPDLAAALAGGAPDAIRPFGGARGHLRQACGPGWALVGDAGSFKDPLAAHGITDALRDAEILARAVLDDDLPAYQEIRDALSLDLLATADEVASFAWDLPGIQSLHRRLSRSMKQEVDYLAALAHPSPCPATGLASVTSRSTRSSATSSPAPSSSSARPGAAPRTS